MASKSDLKTRLSEARERADTETQRVFADAGDLPMYDMLRYFMGYENVLKEPSPGKHGKRTRSALLLIVADMFGGAKSAPVLAAAIELYHNFTLVHDDIEDGDEMRRGQPTVWKEWGVNHAINAGDAQLLLVDKCLLEAASHNKDGLAAAQHMSEVFRGVIEGQYLDFSLTDLPLTNKQVTLDAYLEMTRKKTAILIGVAAAAGGRCAGTDQQTTDTLFAYGEALGMAYQLADDYVSIWADAETTGKRAHGDIYERKKTYPVLYTREHGDTKALTKLYTQDAPFTEAEVKQVIDLLEAAGARDETMAEVARYTDAAIQAADALPLPDVDKKLLGALARKAAASAGVVDG